MERRSAEDDSVAGVEARIAALTERWRLPPGSTSKLAGLLDLVVASPISLTSVRDPLLAVDRHVGDSLSGLAVEELSSATWIADLGSGAGFPGLVLAIALPATRVSLVESVAKKAAFLEAAAVGLGLANVEVVPQRAEQWDAAHGALDVVTCRALAPLGVLVEYAAPLLSIGGLLIAWKGHCSPSEVADGEAAAEVLGMSPPCPHGAEGVEGSVERSLYLSSKLAATPPGYPRRPGMARKRPIRATAK